MKFSKASTVFFVGLQSGLYLNARNEHLGQMEKTCKSDV